MPHGPHPVRVSAASVGRDGRGWVSEVPSPNDAVVPAGGHLAGSSRVKLGVARLGIVGGVDRTRGSFMGRSDVPDVEGCTDDDGEGVRVAGVPSAAAGESALGDGAGGDAGEGGVGEGPYGDRGGVGGGEDAGFGGVPPRARRGAGESDEGGDALQGRAVASRGGVRGGGGGGVDGGGAVGKTPYRAAVVG